MAIPSQACFSAFCQSVSPPASFKLSSQQATGLFALPPPQPLPVLGSAQAAAMLATGLFTGLIAASRFSQFSPPIHQVVTTQTPYLPSGLKRQQYLNFNSPLFALVRLANLYERYHGPLVAYLAACTAGAVGTSLLQGVQETWIRQQETLIRARLVQQLTDTYANSLQQKYEADDQLRHHTRQTIATLLSREGLNPEAYLGRPSDHSPSHRVYYPFAPNHWQSSQMPAFGRSILPNDQVNDRSISTSPPSRWLSAALFATGTALGAGLHQVLRWLAARRDKLSPTQQEVMECIVTSDLESMFLQKNRAMLVVVFGLGILAKVGQLLLNTAREVEVTQQNAQTELRYQQRNWLQIDPQFHLLAEQAAEQHDLKRFAEDLPRLKQQPALLQARIDRLLNDRGQSSPPPYYPATPAVMLTEAKA